LGKREMILRDRLAIERTVLAYLRTAITLIIAGVTLHQLFRMVFFGISTVLIGIFLVFFGYFRLKKVKED
jgi:putative membrane protein